MHIHITQIYYRCNITHTVNICISYHLSITIIWTCLSQGSLALGVCFSCHFYISQQWSQEHPQRLDTSCWVVSLFNTENKRPASKLPRPRGLTCVHSPTLTVVTFMLKPSAWEETSNGRVSWWITLWLHVGYKKNYPSPWRGINPSKCWLNGFMLGCKWMNVPSLFVPVTISFFVLVFLNTFMVIRYSMIFPYLLLIHILTLDHCVGWNDYPTICSRLCW